jgi:hypothetical protein
MSNGGVKTIGIVAVGGWLNDVGPREDTTASNLRVVIKWG